MGRATSEGNEAKSKMKQPSERRGPNPRYENPISLYKTRWVERHSCLKTFGELYEHVVTCLGAMDNPHVYLDVNERRWNWDSDTITMVYGLKGSLQSFWDMVYFTVLKNSLYYLKGSSARPQRRDIDVLEAYSMIDNIKSEIQCLRDEIGVEFQRWYDEENHLAS